MRQQNLARRFIFRKKKKGFLLFFEKRRMIFPSFIVVHRRSRYVTRQLLISEAILLFSLVMLSHFRVRRRRRRRMRSILFPFTFLSSFLPLRKNHLIAAPLPDADRIILTPQQNSLGLRLDDGYDASKSLRARRPWHCGQMNLSPSLALFFFFPLWSAFYVLPISGRHGHNYNPARSLSPSLFIRGGSLLLHIIMRRRTLLLHNTQEASILISPDLTWCVRPWVLSGGSCFYGSYRVNTPPLLHVYKSFYLSPSF